MTAPAMSASEVACYRRHLAGAGAVLEYGTGGSTALAAESGVQRLYSVDSDATWLDKVAQRPAVAAMIAEGRARLVHVDIGPVGMWGKPRNRLLFARWPAYARRPWLDGFAPDVILVDGRFRLSCIMEALKHGSAHVKIAVHDFWNHYPRFRPVLQFTTVVDRADTLAVLAPNGRADGWRAQMLTWRHRYNSR